jgi:hypothetical protein
MNIKLSTQLPAIKNIELTLTTIPNTQENIKELYADGAVQKLFNEFDQTTNIAATVRDLTQAVDLVALAYQNSFNHGLSCAPVVAQIKSGYLSLVSESTSSILNFKDKSQLALFKLSSAGMMLDRIKRIEVGDRTQYDLWDSQLDGFLDASGTASHNDEFESLYEELNIIAKNLDQPTSEVKSSAFAFKLAVNKIKPAIAAKTEGIATAQNQVKQHFVATLQEISDCSRYALEMEVRTDNLVNQSAGLKDQAETAFKQCVEQDVTEKENQRQLEAQMAKQRQRQVELTTRETELETAISDVLEDEKRIEKKLEAASSRAFWSSIVGAVGNAVGSGLNAYANYSTGGGSNLAASSRIQQKVDQADKEVDKQKEKAAKAEEDQQAASDTYKEIQAEHDVLVDAHEQIEEQVKQKKGALSDAKNKLAGLKKTLADLPSIDDTEAADKTKIDKLKESISELEIDIEAKQKTLDELLNNSKDQQRKIDLSKKKVSRSKVTSEETKRAASAAGAALTSLSASMEQFHESAKTELEALSNKEESIIKERRALQKERRDVVVELAGIVVELQQADKANAQLDQLIQALRITAQTMQKILVSFNRIKRFWTSIKDKCHELSEKGNTLTNNVTLAQDSDFKEMQGVIDEVCQSSLFNLVRSWAALSGLNEITHFHMVKILDDLEKSFEQSVDVQQLCLKLKSILEEEVQSIDKAIDNKAAVIDGEATEVVSEDAREAETL